MKLVQLMGGTFHLIPDDVCKILEAFRCEVVNVGGLRGRGETAQQVIADLQGILSGNSADHNDRWSRVRAIDAYVSRTFALIMPIHLD